MIQAMLLRLAYLGVSSAIAMLRLLPIGDLDKDVEILALRHQITVLERQLHGDKPQFAPADRAFLAALLHRLPRDMLHRIRLLVRPDTSYAGTATSSRAATRGSRGRTQRPSTTVRSVRALVLAWPGRTTRGATAESTAHSSSSA